jgi:hypothetical protein
VKFLVDAQLPARLARLLNEHGHDATHTSELPNANRTPDDEIAATADTEDRVVISKDRDFRNSHFLKGTPAGSSSSTPATSPTTNSSRSSKPTSNTSSTPSTKPL